ncbi:MAG: SgcJ/EcaC family oxidoreductase [bacterium]
MALSGSIVAVLLLVGCDRAAPSEALRSESATSSTSGGVLSPTTASQLIVASPSDVAAVTAVVTAWDAAWNAGDATALAATFWGDAEFINGRGQLAVGSPTIRSNHATNLAGVFKGSHTQSGVRKITFMSATAAVVDADNDVTNFKALPPGAVPTAPGVISQRQKRVVVKRDGEWRVLLMQLTSIAPAPAPPPPPAP